MDWTIVVLVLILIALWSIKDVLGKIAWHLIQISTSIDQKPVSQSPNMSGIEQQLKNIFKLMGGEAKMKEENTKKRKDIYARYVKARIINGLTPKQAKAEANDKFEEADFKETHYAPSWENYLPGLYDVESYVIAVELEERNKKKYGNLLPTAREFIKGKTIIQPNEMNNLRDTLKIDYDGQEWIIQKLMQEKRLEKIGEYSTEEDRYVLEHYKVLETQK
jgi:hypothetical protein